MLGMNVDLAGGQGAEPVHAGRLIIDKPAGTALRRNDAADGDLPAFLFESRLHHAVARGVLQDRKVAASPQYK